MAQAQKGEMTNMSIGTRQDERRQWNEDRHMHMTVRIVVRVAVGSMKEHETRRARQEAVI